MAFRSLTKRSESRIGLTTLPQEGGSYIRVGVGAPLDAVFLDDAQQRCTTGKKVQQGLETARELPSIPLPSG